MDWMIVVALSSSIISVSLFWGLIAGALTIYPLVIYWGSLIVILIISTLYKIYHQNRGI